MEIPLTRNSADLQPNTIWGKIGVCVCVSACGDGKLLAWPKAKENSHSRKSVNSLDAKVQSEFFPAFSYVSLGCTLGCVYM